MRDDDLSYVMESTAELARNEGAGDGATRETLPPHHIHEMVPGVAVDDAIAALSRASLLHLIMVLVRHLDLHLNHLTLIPDEYHGDRITAQLFKDLTTMARATHLEILELYKLLSATPEITKEDDEDDGLYKYCGEITRGDHTTRLVIHGRRHPNEPAPTPDQNPAEGDPFAISGRRH